MKRSGSLLLVAMALTVGPRIGALEFALRRSFPTDFITSSPLRSLSVSPQEDLFLMAFRDGSIFEVTRDLQTVTRILPRAEPPEESTWVGYYGLTLIRPQNMFVAFAFGTGAYLFYTRQGTFTGGLARYHHASYTGAFFEEKEPVGNIHALFDDAYIEQLRLSVPKVFLEIVMLPLDLIELAGRLVSFQHPGLTGIAYIAPADVYLVSLSEGQIFAISKTEKWRFSPNSSVWESRIDAQVDLRPLGVHAIDDLTWDPVLERLYLADGSQSMVFELDLAPSGPPFHRGDPDDSGLVDLGDPAFLLDYLFLGGSEPSCLESADANNDGKVEISDAVFLIGFLFGGRETPPPPGPPGEPCGREPDLWDSQIGLGCKSYPRC